jgi:DNA-binding GntR family transcriptional regulator
MNEEILVKVDRNRAIPLYYQVSESLEQMIKSGEIRANEQMLSEEILADRFGVSRPTVNKAIAILIKKSLLSREKGKGTFVPSGDVRLTLMQELVSLHESMQRENIRFRTVVLEIQRRKADAALAEKLSLKEGSRICYIKRLRYVEEETLIISESYLPSELFPDLEKVDLRDCSLYDVLEQKYGIPVVKTERNARAVKALDQDAQLLRIPLGDPLIQLEGIAFSKKDLRVEYFKTIIRGDRGVLCTTLYRRKGA